MPGSRSRLFLRLLTLILVIVLIPGLWCANSEPSRDLLLIKGGTLIDGTGRPPVKNAWILIEKGFITRVGQAGDFHPPREARVLRARRLTILPGLIDAHVHLVGSGVVGYSYHSPQLRGYPVYLRNLRAELMGGVTLVRDLNMPLPLAHRLSQAVQEDPTQGARLIYSGPILAAVDGYGSPYSTPVASPEEGRLQVQQLVREGAGVIKVASTRRDFAGDRLRTFSPEILDAIVEEAHAQGLPVAAHVAGAAVPEVRAAVEAGVDSLEHMPGESGPLDMPDTFYSDPGLLPEILKRRTTIVPTLSVEAGDDFGPTQEDLWNDPALLLRLDQDQRETLARNVEDFRHNSGRQATAQAGKRRMEMFLEEMRKLHAAGVRLGVGTDAGNGLTFHGNLFTEIEYLHQGGLTPMEALEAATRGNAELLRVSDITGTVQEGKRADILLVRGDPLRDLAALHQVQYVIVAGNVLDVGRLLQEADREERKRNKSAGSAR
jgi:imidazolonepropionase-like amidohydrolase